MQRYELLSRQGVERIHEATLHVLQHVGIKFTFQPALEVLAKGGAKVEGNKVYFSPKLVEEQIKKAPSEFTLYARNPKNNVTIGMNSFIFTPGYGAPFVTDLDNGRRKATMRDYENFAKLSQTSQYQDIVGGMLAEPNDIPHEIRHAKMIYACIKNSDKSFMGSVMGAKGARDSIKMAAILFGGEKELEKRPALISIVCSLTPLGYDDRMTGALMEYAKAGQPQLISSLSIAGSTSPATLAGTLVVQNAEVLAGIVLAQLVREGTPVVYAAASSSTDMRYGTLSIGAPENALCVNATAQLARFYNLPCRGGGCISDAKVPDAQGAYESMMNLLMAEVSGINFVLHAAGILESYNCMSYEKFILDDEICGMVKRIRRGLEVNDDNLALDVIAEVGAGGHFLDKEHTYMHFKSEFFLPTLSNRSAFDLWKDNGALQAMEVANKKWKEALEKFEAPDLPAEIDKELQHFIAELS